MAGMERRDILLGQLEGSPCGPTRMMLVAADYKRCNIRCAIGR
jgi:hypothetical protein